ncbi:hypothetical protein Ms3S1_33640 [Methylosinus sp. 3S-1]
MRNQQSERGNAGVIRGVQLHRPHIQPFFLQGGASGFAPPEIATSEQNIYSSAREASRNRKSDSAIGAADQGKSLIRFHFVRP